MKKENNTDPFKRLSSMIKTSRDTLLSLIKATNSTLNAISDFNKGLDGLEKALKENQSKKG